MEGMTLAELFKNSPMNVVSYGQHLKETATYLGLPFGKWLNIYNSRLAQELGLWADSQNKGNEFCMAVFKAYLVDGKNFADKNVLMNLAESTGLSRVEAGDVLEQRPFKDAVDRDWDASKKLRVTAVPTLIFNGRQLVGARSYEEMVQLIKGDLL